MENHTVIPSEEPLAKKSKTGAKSNPKPRKRNYAWVFVGPENVKKPASRPRGGGGRGKGAGGRRGSVWTFVGTASDSAVDWKPGTSTTAKGKATKTKAVTISATRSRAIKSSLSPTTSTSSDDSTHETATNGTDTTDGSTASGSYVPPKTVETVHSLLKSLGVKSPNRVSCCLKAGILNGCVKLLPPEHDPEKKFGLDQVLLSDNCPYCSIKRKHTCKVKTILYQSDYGGDYGSGGEGSRVKCRDCGGLYVTGICHGEPSFECGKFHNHCTECPMFGQCIGDYREQHCQKCGNHYHGTFGMFPCYYCEDGEKESASTESEDDA